MKTGDKIQLFGTLIAALGILFGGYQFKEGAEAQREAATVALMRGQLELSIDKREYAVDPECAGLDPSRVWFAYHAIFTAEAIYALQPDDWRPTVESLIRDYRFLPDNPCFPWDEYDETFKEVVRGVLAENDAQ